MQRVPGGDAEGVPAVPEYRDSRSERQYLLQRAVVQGAHQCRGSRLLQDGHPAARLHHRRLSDRPRHEASGDQLRLPAERPVGAARRSRLRGAKPGLADDGARERRLSAGRHPRRDRPQWHGARAPARCRRLDRQDAAGTERSRDRVQPEGRRSLRSRRRARNEPALGARPAHSPASTCTRRWERPRPSRSPTSIGAWRATSPASAS